MSLLVAKKAFDYILLQKEKIGGNPIIFDFIGGEPFIAIDLLNNLCTYIENRIKEVDVWSDCYKFRISTNGLNYNSVKVQEFIRIHKPHLEVSISIDGTKIKNDTNRVFANGQGSYDSIIDNVKLWVSQFDNSFTRMVVSHDDLPYVFESVKHLISLGIKTIDINYIMENVWKYNDGKIFENQLTMLADYIIKSGLSDTMTISLFKNEMGKPVKDEFEENPCGKGMLAVDCNGDFYTCMRFAAYSLRTKTPRKIGNINDGIDWNKLRPYIAIDPLSYYSPTCLQCEIASGCRTCQAENYDSSITGTIFQRSSVVCQMHKAAVKACNYYNNKLKYGRN